LYIYEKEYKDDPEALHKNAKDYDHDKFIINSKNRYFFNRKMRWSNLGHYYDWDHRCYFKESHSEIPDNFKSYAKRAIDLLKIPAYNPEAVIINYYCDTNYMGGHLDDGEPDQIHPIISFSLGLSCIFLIGGETRDTEPLAVRLNSGDLCIMSEESRRCFHGVPKVMKNSFKLECKDKIEELKAEHATNQSEKNDIYNAYVYLTENRINFNFRQVIL
jgi:alkylated DNA repair protein alkB family protein 1